MTRFEHEHWHIHSVSETVDRLATDHQKGLSQDEAAARLATYGPNAIPAGKAPSLLARFAAQLKEPLVVILIISAIIAAALSHHVDAAVILAVVLLNAVIGTLQETKAHNALALLAQSVEVKTRVVRDGDEQEIKASELVPGDLVVLEAGSKVPADLRLFESQGLMIDESALTGESLPVTKSTNPHLDREASLAERPQMAFASTFVLDGQGKGLVVATASKTEIGKVAELVRKVQTLETPLTADLRKLSRFILILILGLAALNVLVGISRGLPMIELLLATVALAVGAIPEGLPAAVTITLAIGVSRMARRKAIIRKLPAVETLGCTTVICSDKTGTLTENRMTVQALATAERLYHVGGDLPVEGDSAGAGEHRYDKAATELLHCAVLCNDAKLARSDNETASCETRQHLGDPLEVALLRFAQSEELHPAVLCSRYPRRDEVPFSADRRLMATCHETPEGQSILYIKGAAERILDSCECLMTKDGTTAPLGSEQRVALGERAHDLASSGLRILACCSRIEDAPAAPLSDDSLPAEGMTFLGFIGLMDPPRTEAREAVARCQEAGVQIKMITGDAPGTALALAKRVGIVRAETNLSRSVMTGPELTSLSDDELSERLPHTAVFARATPAQKLRLVQMLQRHGHVTAMTGDGVNDAPALRQADIGIAMGNVGTAVARESADMVLTDDNFATIVGAIEEGRGVYANLQKFVTWTLPTNLAEGLVILTAIFLGAELPILPLQILWINMSTAVFLGLTLAFEPGEHVFMERPPRDRRQPLLDRSLLTRTTLIGIFAVAAVFGLFQFSLDQGLPLPEARTVAVNTLIAVEIFYLFNCRVLQGTAFRIGVFSNPYANGGVLIMIALQAAFIYAPPFQAIFQTAPPPPITYVWISLCGLTGGFLMGAHKMWSHRQERKNSQSQKPTAQSHPPTDDHQG